MIHPQERSIPPSYHNIQKGESVYTLKARVFIIHAGAFAAFFFEPTIEIIIAAITFYFFRVGGLVVGYHRYFAHKAFETSRVFQFVLACIGASGGFRGPLWWASVHRVHHQYSDQKNDPHSPLHGGRWHAHLGFIFNEINTNLLKVKDFARFPELIWLNKYHYIVPYTFLIIVYLLGQYTEILGARDLGIQSALWIFFLPTVIGINSIASLNSVTHGIVPNQFFIYKEHKTSDTSTNCWLLALPTLGESWHNNHHKYPYSARCGIKWWQIDVGYYIIWMLEKVGIIWGVKLAKN